jgi:hypothetical protein
VVARDHQRGGIQPGDRAADRGGGGEAEATQVADEQDEVVPGPTEEGPSSASPQARWMSPMIAIRIRGG